MTHISQNNNKKLLYHGTVTVHCTVCVHILYHNILVYKHIIHHI